MNKIIQEINDRMKKIEDACEESDDNEWDTLRKCKAREEQIEKVFDEIGKEYSECKEGENDEWWCPECTKHNCPHFECNDKVSLLNDIKMKLEMAK